MVVASLLQNLPNLAGLCRTAESLGAEALVIPDKTAVSSEAFKRQSVTSEKWLPLVEVTPGDVAAYLAEQRERGQSWGSKQLRVVVSSTAVCSFVCL